MSKRRDKRKYNKRKSRAEERDEEESAPATSMSWTGTGVRVNSLTGKGTFDPKVPIDQPGDEGDDALIWADVPDSLKYRLEDKPQLITQDCLLDNAKGILRLYENDIIHHVIKQQLRSEHMTSLLRRQGTYKEGLSASETRMTATKLAKSSFLGRDPTGARPIPASLWDGDELSERGTLLKDVQDMVWDYLRVHMPRILGPVVLTRVQGQE